jgi:hypothetical protein
VAGTFYPGDAAELSSVVEGYLATALAETSSDAPWVTPKALIVPHAGYIYSGPIAASAYARLTRARETIRRVVLLGPSHRVAVRGLAATTADAFLTPLGEVPIDREALEQSLTLPQVHLAEGPHLLEHSLEVQLPFLQCVLTDFSLVPFSVGDATTEEVREVLDLLWGGDETLILISSDLSHYYDYENACRLDAATTSAIEALDPEALELESACGRVPVCGLLQAAARHSLKASTIDHRNSGDTAGSRNQVVGYGAYAFSPVRSQYSS